MRNVIDILPGIAIPEAELVLSFSRSGGPGGQNVNKVSTRVELSFDVGGSRFLSRQQKETLREVLGSRLGTDGALRVQSQESRSQWQNRRMAIEKFRALLRRALGPKKPRLSSRPTAGSREQRFKAKRRKGEVKRHRRRVSHEE
jgi:ribosome-associated protein